jgi:cytochrome P450
MNADKTPDWDPTALGAPIDQGALYDATRRRCPVAHSDLFGWSLFGHEDVWRALHDPAAFSNAVSQHLAVPNGADPPLHTDYRRIIDPYFAPDRMAKFEPECRRVARSLVEALGTGHPIELNSILAEPFAVRAQCASLQWPAEFHAPLREWIRKNQEAIRSRDRHSLAAVAFEFDGHIRNILAAHRNGKTDIAGPIVGKLLGESVGGRPITDDEIVSILRNWTVGELATISACIGLVAHFIAERPTLQARLRGNPSLLPTAIDEILRIRAPLMTSRRVVAAPVEIGGRHLRAGDRVTLMWASANRDERTFDDPEEFNLERDPGKNLLYGAGIHVCPGAPLARLELRVLFEELLARFELSPVREQPPAHAMYPAAGYSSLHLIVHRLGPATQSKESIHG